jgi:hypothetical protein
MAAVAQLFFVVRRSVVLTGLARMLGGVQMMAMRQMGVMRRLLVVGRAVVLRGLAVMVGGRLVMHGGLVVMLGELLCVHVEFSDGAD